MNKQLDDLKAIIADESLPSNQRHDALKLLCKELDDTYEHVPEPHLKFVVAAMLGWTTLGLKSLSLKDASEAVSSGFARRETTSERRT
jgi:hypothetical protein